MNKLDEYVDEEGCEVLSAVVSLLCTCQELLQIVDGKDMTLVNKIETIRRAVANIRDQEY